MSAGPTLQPWNALILAAGAGTRMGHVPKGLIRVDGAPLIARLVSALLACEATHALTGIVVVLGHHAAALRAALSEPADPRLHTLVLDTPAEQADSLRAGLARLDTLPAAQATLVCLTDQPGIDAGAIDALHAAWTRRPDGIDMLVPVVNGTPGNPVMLGSTVGADLLAAPTPQTGRDWRKLHPGRVLAWPAPHAAFTLDLDTREDVQRLVAQGWRIDLPESTGPTD